MVLIRKNILKNENDNYYFVFNFKRIFALFFLLLVILKLFNFGEIKYNNSKHIDNSSKILGISQKYKYIKENHIEEKTGMNTGELIFEWTWHNMIYYCDIFKILDSHTKDVDFGN